MDFEDTPQEAAFRAEARAWLEANAPLRAPGERVPGLFSGPERPELVAEARAWQARKAEAGWAGITWPREYGGRGGTVLEQVIWNQEESHYRVPPDIFAIGIGIAGPVLMVHGTPEQKARYLWPLLAGEEIWCQLFSEPGAGSDLAGVRTRAECRGDEWVVNGQKLWVSGAHYSRFGTLLCRTDPDVPKHQGLTYFILDLQSPGVEIRPLRQITGGAHFSEVFLTDVRIPDVNRVGAVGDGWRVAVTTLMFERLAAIGSLGMVGMLGFSDLAALAEATVVRGRRAIDDPWVRQRLASFYVRSEAMRFTSYRVLTELSRGGVPGPEGSVGKLIRPRLAQEMGALALELLGAMGALTGDEVAAGWQEVFFAGTGLRIAGGTDEIQRNIIGERLLGLPPEPRADKDVPFRDVPTGPRG